MDANSTREPWEQVVAGDTVVYTVSDGRQVSAYVASAPGKTGAQASLMLAAGGVPLFIQAPYDDDAVPGTWRTVAANNAAVLAAQAARHPEAEHHVTDGGPCDACGPQGPEHRIPLPHGIDLVLPGKPVDGPTHVRILQDAREALFKREADVREALGSAAADVLRTAAAAVGWRPDRGVSPTGPDVAAQRTDIPCMADLDAAIEKAVELAREDRRKEALDPAPPLNAAAMCGAACTPWRPSVHALLRDRADTLRRQANDLDRLVARLPELDDSLAATLHELVVPGLYRTGTAL